MKQGNKPVNYNPDFTLLVQKYLTAAGILEPAERERASREFEVARQLGDVTIADVQTHIAEITAPATLAVA